MKVWIGYEAYFDGGIDIYRHPEEVFDCEVKAFLWVEEKQPTIMYGANSKRRK